MKLRKGTSLALCLCFVILTLSFAVWASLTVEQKGYFETNAAFHVHGLDVVGDYAYLANRGNGLRVVNISDPENPEEVGSCDIPSSYAYGIHVVGDYAYLADGNDGLQVIDVSDPTNPKEVGTCDTPGESRGVYVSGNYAYMADYNGGFRVINVFNPQNPHEVAFLETEGNAYRVYVVGNYAYVGADNRGLRIIDVSAPSNPKEVGVFDPIGGAERARGIHVVGDYAYIAGGSAGLYVIDVSDPTAPTQTGLYNTPGEAYTVHVTGGHAYVADGNQGLRVVDVSDPAAPTEVESFVPGRHQKSICVTGGYAYLGGDAGMYILQSFVPANFTVQIDPGSIPAGVTSTAIVTATVTDTSGNPLLGQEVEMEVTEGHGIVTGVTDNGDGTYTGNYRATNQTGTEIITITVMGVSETVSIVLTEPSGVQFTIQSSFGSLPADGASTGTITTTVTDDAGNPLTNQDVEVTVSTGQGTVGSVTDNGDGTYTATYTASNQPGPETITVTVAGNSQTLDIVLTEVEVVVDARELIIPEVAGAPGDSITVPVNISDAAGVSGADITVAYDANILIATEGRKTVLSSAMNLETNIGIPGQLILSMASTEPIASGSGALVEMVFTISANAEADTETPLTFTDAELYDAQLQTIPAETQDGKVVIGPACMKGDVNGNGRIQSNDAILTLRISAQLMTATPYQECAADMNDDGRVRANDAIAILRAVAGLTAPGVDSAVNTSRQVSVTLAEARGVAGETITIPLKVDDTAGLAGGDVCIAYNSKVLRAVDVSSNSSILLASNAAEPGMLRIAFASTNRLSSETIAEIQFRVLTDGVSPLKIQNAELYGTDTLSLDSRFIDRQFESWAIPAERNALLQNFPNPFNPETWIPYQLKEESGVVISIYNTSGDLIRELDLGHKSGGFYMSSDRAAYWDGMNKNGETVSSGVYFYSIRANDFADVRKLTILK